MKRVSFLFLMMLTVSITLVLSFQSFAQDEAPIPAWDVVVVGHRGLAPGYPENTLTAFENSIALGVNVIEIDLQGTADGEVVILHDGAVNRTTNGMGLVCYMTLEEVKALDAGSYVSDEFADQRIPTYEEVLTLVKDSDTQLLLDIKSITTLDIERVVRLTEKHGATLDVIIGVRTVSELKEFHALNPNLRTLGFIFSVFTIDEFIEAGVDIIRLFPEWIYADNQLVEYVHSKGKSVWTRASDPRYDALEQLIRSGVNGILTDDPEVLAQLLQDIEAGVVQ